MHINVNKLIKHGRAVFLAYDQGLEHGPRDLNGTNVDPKYIFDIALDGMYDAVIVQSGLAEKYYYSYYRDIPLVVKLNGKTRLTDNMPFSPTTCSVDRAVKLGAAAVGYTIYPGSPMEPQMFSEFAKIVEQAHDYGLPVMTWLYPRGPKIANELDTDITAYSARIGLELGADILKLKYNHDVEGLKWVVKCAGRAKVMISGGDKTDEHEFLKTATDVMKTGAAGIAVGRNIWQHDRPLALSKALRMIVHHNMSIDDALKLLEEESHKNGK